MKRRPISGRLLERLAAATCSAYDADRRHNPERFMSEPDGLGPAHLFVENVARMIGCNVDYVRRISRNALPASKIGARLIYARADVEAYIAAHRDRGRDHFVSSRAPRASATGKAASSEKKKLQRGAPFDPVAHVRQALKSS